MPIRTDRLLVWSADLAYCLGLLLTDGNVRVTDRGSVASFVSLDRCSAEFVRDFICPESAVREERTKAGGTAYRWTLWGIEVVALLGGLGILPNKSLVCRMPPIPDAFVWDFIRGVLDGDGSVDKAGRANFATGSPGFASDLAALFALHGLKATVQQNSRALSVYLNVASSRRLATLMYHPGCPHLARKRARFTSAPHTPFV